MKRILVKNMFYQVIDVIADHIAELEKKADILASDNQQLMAQISAKWEQNPEVRYNEVAFEYAEPLLRIATALEVIAESLKLILITKEVTND